MPLLLQMTGLKVVVFASEALCDFKIHITAVATVTFIIILMSPAYHRRGPTESDSWTHFQGSTVSRALCRDVRDLIWACLYVINNYTHTCTGGKTCKYWPSNSEIPGLSISAGLTGCKQFSSFIKHYVLPSLSLSLSITHTHLSVCMSP